MKKRAISLVLAFVLIISLFPVRGLAMPMVVSDEMIGVSDVLIEEYEGSYELNSNVGTSDYRQWAQGDSRWGSTRLGSSSYTMSSSGCLVTAITKIIIQAGLKDSGSFNPGTMVNWLNSNSGFDSSGNLYWAKPATYSGMTNYGNLVSYGSYSSSGNNGQIITWINQGYHIVLNVNNGGHWIAVDEAKTLATGKVYIMDSLLNSANADVALADRYSTFNLAHAYKGGKTPPGEHDCDKGTYKYNWDAHPHYKCYACSVCGKINEFRDETVPLNTCDQCRPGKPVLDVDTNDDGVVTFSWSNTANTTHYNVWLQEKDESGEWDTIEQFFRVESGFTHTLEIGEYRAQLLSYSDKMWEPDGSDWVHTWADDVYFNIEGCKHNYTSTRVDATCVDYGYTTYTCTKCGDTYTVYDGDYTEWSTTKPVGVDESLIESKTQYRYADKETKTSYEPSLSGWTRVGSSWQQNGSGSVTYVKSWPSGFRTSHSLYSTYNKTPKSASETTTDKTTINSDNVSGYLYYHWCRGTYQNGPDNRKSRNTQQEDCNTFCAFYSTTAPSSLTAAGDGDGSYRHDNPNCCKDSYWYFYTPVNTQSYTTYRNLFSYERWGTWSDWSDTVYTGSSNRKVETRTLYRAVEVELGDHDYQNGYCSDCGAVDPDYIFEPVILGVADVSAAPGETVTIPVTISDNTGFAGFTLCIDYNEFVMTLTNISKGSLLNTSESGAFTKNVSGKTINWVDSVNITGDGELMKLTFTIDADATPGSYDVGLSLKDGNSANFVDENSHAIHVEFESGSVSVQEPAPVVVLEKIEVATKPTKTVYQIGESLDTTGLTLKATYSDGTTKKISSGFTVSGFDSATAGTKTVTVRYEGKTATFTATVKQKEIDPNAPKILIGSVTACAGNNITVEAKLENNPGISSVSMMIDYDTTRLKLENAQFGTEISNGAFANYNLPYIALVRSGNCDEDVTLVTMTFSVLADAEEGDAYVTLMYEEGDVADNDEVDVNFEVIPGCVTVIDYIPGDINGDNKVNSKDLTRLLKYISHEDVEIHAFSRPKNNSQGSGVSPKITVGSASAAQGKTVEVTVDLENNPGISSAVLEIDYDKERLSLTSASIGEKFSTGAFTNIHLPYVTFVRSGDIAEDELLLTLSFVVNSDAELGEAYVTILYEDGDITNYNEEDVSFEVEAGKIVVVCGHGAMREVPAKNADCENMGNHFYYICDSCGLMFKADGITETTVEAETIEALGHSFTSYTADGNATCLEDGTKTAKCDRCDVIDSIPDEGSALGHNWNEGIVTVEPTGETEGEILYTCNRCLDTKTEVIPRLEHSHSYEVVIVAPTCTEDGYSIYICECGEYYVADDIAALGHNWEGSSCSRCDATRENPFVDVPEGIFLEPVLWAVEKGITTGTSATTFDPLGQCGRATVVIFLWRAAGSPEPTATVSPFTDVNINDWYAPAVLWAVEKGITTGTSATTFSPFEVCNRTTVVTFLWRYMGEPEASTACGFSDVPAGAWFEAPINWAVEEGITNGIGNNLFDVLGVCNRVQVVTFLHRLMS